MTEGGCVWLAAVVKIRKKKTEDSMNAIHAALAGHRSMKMVTVVDEDIDIDENEKFVQENETFRERRVCNRILRERFEQETLR